MSDAAWWWSWLLTATGLICFYLAGKKVWWAWYVGLLSQLLWLSYALLTAQYGFLAGTALYSIVYARNCVQWTREHRQEQASADAD